MIKMEEPNKDSEKRMRRSQLSSMVVLDTLLRGTLPRYQIHGRWNFVHDSGNLPKPDVRNHEAKPRIMIVDDEKKIASLYASILESAGYEVTHIVSDGLEAVNAIERHENVDLVIMDQKMPKMNGIEATDRIKEVKPDVKVIMISAYEIPRANKGAFAAILEKPISKSQLLETIRNA